MDKEYVSFECVHIAEADIKNPDERHALVYADIDGYPADENEEGTVICRVWLLRKPVDNMNNKGFIVDWHHNGYRMNESVLELITKAKTDLMSYASDIVEQVFNRAYERYRLKWMLDHWHSMDDLLEKLQKELNKGAADVYEAIGSFENNDGFNGNVLEVWHDRDIFRKDEWTEDDVMRTLLNSEDYGIWKNK